jgi:uncharacterized glyoxalase superfamily protein PhnB
MSRFLKIAPRLPVNDLTGAIAFYTNVLGFAGGPCWSEENPTFAVLERDAVQVQLIVAEPAFSGAAGSATISIEVDAAQSLCESLRPHAAIEWGPEVYWYGRREFAVKDPSGNLLIFSEPTEDPPTCHDED